MGLARDTHFSASQADKTQSGVSTEQGEHWVPRGCCLSAQEKVQKDCLDAKALPPTTYTQHSPISFYLDQVSADNRLL